MQTLNQEASSVSENTEQASSELELPQAVGFSGNEPDAKDSSDSSNEDIPDAKKEPETLLDAVLRATDKKATETTPVDSSTTTDPVDGKVKADSKDASAEKSPEDLEKLPFHNHPRWKEVQAERDSYRERAERYDGILTYMRENQLSDEEMDRGVSIMALMKRDPVAALEALRPTIESLMQFAGQTLPPDLAQRVEHGLLDEQTAAELARTRNQTAFTQQKQQEQEQIRSVQMQQAQAEQHRASLFDAVSYWEDGIRASDPDYALKADSVNDRYRVLIAQYPPRNAAEATNLAAQAHADVTARFQTQMQRRQPVRSVGSNVSSASSSVQAPKTLLEAAWAAVGK